MNSPYNNIAPNYRRALFCFLTLLFYVLATAQPQLLQMRENCYKASVDSKEADRFYKSFEGMAAPTPVQNGYKAIAELMICNHAYNPYKKMSYFSKGKNTLESAIKTDPSSPELRFLRYSVQTNDPSFLGYNKNVEEDRSIIIRALQKKQVDEDLHRRIENFLLESPKTSPAEKQNIAKL